MFNGSEGGGGRGRAWPRGAQAGDGSGGGGRDARPLAVSARRRRRLRSFPPLRSAGSLRSARLVPAALAAAARAALPLGRSSSSLAARCSRFGRAVSRPPLSRRSPPSQPPRCAPSRPASSSLAPALQLACSPCRASGPRSLHFARPLRSASVSRYAAAVGTAAPASRLASLPPPPRATASHRAPRPSPPPPPSPLRAVKHC